MQNYGYYVKGYCDIEQGRVEFKGRMNGVSHAQVRFYIIYAMRKQFNIKCWINPIFEICTYITDKNILSTDKLHCILREYDDGIKRHFIRFSEYESQRLDKVKDELVSQIKLESCALPDFEEADKLNPFVEKDFYPTFEPQIINESLEFKIDNVDVPKVKRDKCNDLIDKGLERYRNRDYESAIELYEQALNLSDSNYIIYYHIANCLSYMLGKKEEAIKYFDKCIDIKPDFLEAYLDKAAVAKNIPGYIHNGINALECSIKYHPDNANIYSQLSDLYIDLYINQLNNGENNTETIFKVLYYCEIGLNTHKALKWDSENKKWKQDRNDEYLKIVHKDFRSKIENIT